MSQPLPDLHALPIVMSGRELAATARRDGALTLLFAETPPAEPSAVLGWLRARGLEQDGVSVELEGTSLLLAWRGEAVRAVASPDPYPEEAIDPASRAPQIVHNRGALTLLWPTEGPGRAASSAPWGPSGSARVMTVIARALLRRAKSIVVHAAGEVAMSWRTFVPLLGDPCDPACVPFEAWVVQRSLAGGVLGSRGMAAFGLPEVRVEGFPMDTWGLSRSYEAALYACFRLCRGLALEPGPLEVPLRVQVGARLAEVLGEAEVERWDARYEAADAGATLVLSSRADSDDVGERWAHTPQRITHGGYEALYLRGLMDLLRVGQVAQLALPDAPVPFRVVTLRARPHYLVLATSGLGRVAQPAGTRERGSDHVELCAFAPIELAGPIQETLVRLARTLHAPRERAGFEPLAAYAEGGGRRYLLRPWGPIGMGTGAPVTLLEVIPLHSVEQEGVAREQVLPNRDPAATLERWRFALGAPG